jgi:hypothetical protein
MIDGKRIAVVMPAYNADKTLEATVLEQYHCKGGEGCCYGRGR